MGMIEQVFKLHSLESTFIFDMGPALFSLIIDAVKSSGVTNNQNVQLIQLTSINYTAYIYI